MGSICHAGRNNDTEQVQYYEHTIKLCQQYVHWGKREVQQRIFPNQKIDNSIGCT